MKKVLSILLCFFMLMNGGVVSAGSLEKTSGTDYDYVYRFWSDVFRGHFFTIDYNEATKVKDTDSNWNYEKIAYSAYKTQVTGTVPVYRFWSDKFHGHFYTIDQAEYQKVKDTDSNWKYEWVAYYVYPLNYSGPIETEIVYRFWSPIFLHHFYTSDYNEMVKVRDTDSNWDYEGEAFKVPNGSDVVDDNQQEDNTDNIPDSVIQTPNYQPYYNGFVFKVEIPSASGDYSDVYKLLVEDGFVIGSKYLKNNNTGVENFNWIYNSLYDEGIFNVFSDFDRYNNESKEIEFYSGYYKYENIEEEWTEVRISGHFEGNQLHYTEIESREWPDEYRYTTEGVADVEFVPITKDMNYTTNKATIKADVLDMVYYLPGHPSYEDKKNICLKDFCYIIIDHFETEQEVQNEGYTKALRHPN